MDSFIIIVIIMVVLGLLEKLVKAGRAGQTPETPPEGPDWESQGEGRAERLPRDLQELIAEELGIKLERPRIEEEPAGVSSERPELERSAALQPPMRAESRIEPPTRGAPGRRMPRSTPGRRTPSITTRARRTRTVAYPSTPPTHPPPTPQPVKVTPAGAVISLEDRAAMERGEAVSLETPRMAEQHQRFHDLYVDRGEPTRARRRARPILPDRADWTAVHRAVVWSEILGPPRGLVE